jgi:hypothetical protein
VRDNQIREIRENQFAVRTCVHPLCRARGPEVVALLQQQVSALVFLP